MNLGVIAGSATLATHVVYKESNNVDTTRAIRVLDKKDGRLLVHFVKCPDSYNQWIDEADKQQYHDVTNESNNNNTTTSDTSSPVNVTANWVLDSFAFNEWANVKDYIYEEPRTSLKRSVDEASSSLADDSNPAKKSRTPNQEEQQQQQQQQQQSTDNNEKQQATTNGTVNEAAKQKEMAKKYIAVQTHEIIIPSYAAWFELGSIHDIERRSLPEFFNNRNKSKTPSVYKEYRDFMVNTYRLNPLEYLTVTACRRNMTGDVCAIIRVHAFLEQWGLINYQVCENDYWDES